MPSGSPPDRPPAPRRGSTLRFRLTFWNTVGLLLLGAATLVGLRQGLHVTLSRELDRLTVEDTAEIALEVERAGSGLTDVTAALDRKARSNADRAWFGQVVGPEGQVLAQAGRVPNLD